MTNAMEDEAFFAYIEEAAQRGWCGLHEMPAELCACNRPEYDSERT